MNEGLEIENHLRFNGASDDVINQWKSDTTQHLQDSGASGQQIKDYFGVKEPDTSAMNAHVAANLKKPENQKPINNIYDAFKHGWETGVTGLMQHKPEFQDSPGESIAQKFVQNAGQMASDLPAMMAGGAIGMLGGPTTAAAGAFAVPAAMRKMLMDHYEKGDITDTSEFARRVVGTTWEAAKGGMVGVATALTGGSMKVLNAFGSPLVQAATGTAGALAAEVAAQTTVSSALEGHLPKAEDFLNGAIAIGGLHAVLYTAPKLRSIYAETGLHPADVIESANENPDLKGELLSENPNLPKDTGIKNPPAVIDGSGGGEEPPSGNVPAKPEDVEAQPPKTAAESDIDYILKTHIGEAAEEPKQSIAEQVKDNFTSAYAKHLDYTAVIKDAISDIGDGPITDKNAHVLMRLHAAVQDKVMTFVEKGTRDFNTGEINGESLTKILDDQKATGDEGLRKFKAYGIAARTLELGSRNIEQIGTKEHSDAQSVYRRVLLENADVKPQFDRLVAYKNRTLDYVAASGRYSDEQVAAFKELNSRYISFKKIMEPDPITGKVEGTTKGIKAIGDSEKQIQDPILSTLQDVDYMVRMAHETQATNMFIDAMRPHADMTPASGPSGETEISGQGLPQIEGQVRTENVGVKESIMRLSADQNGIPSDTQIAEYVDGKRTLYDTKPEIADSIKRMAGNPAAMTAWTTLLKPFAATLRMGTVNNPLFAIRHLWRNGITAATLSQTGLKPFESLFYAKEYFKGSDKVDNFIYDGGAVNSVMPLAQGYLDGKIYELDHKAPFTEKAWNTLKTVGSFSHAMIVAGDNISRFAEYSRMLEKGATRTESAFAAREVLPDYQKAGLQKSALQQVTAFLNVHMQGQARMGQEIKENALGYVAKNLAYITVPSVLLAAAQYKDDAINDLPPWQKYNYWAIHLSNWRPANSLAEAMSVKSAYPSNYREMPDGSHQVNDGNIFRVQKPFTNGILFGSAVEATLDAIRKHDPGAFGAFAKTVAGSVIAEPIPSALAPIAEQMTNRSFYTDQPLVRQSMENKLPEMQYDRYTSDTAKLLGKALSYVPLVRDIGPSDAKISSPKVIENYIHGWGGTMGNYAVQALDVALRKAGVADSPVKPTNTLAEIPFVKEFVIRFPNARPESVADFEERYKQSDRILQSIKMLYKSGDSMGAAKLQQRYGANMDRMQGIDKAIQNLNGSVQKVYAAPDIDPVQKRQLIDSMMYQMVTMSKLGNNLMDNIEKPAQNKPGSN